MKRFAKLLAILIGLGGVVESGAAFAWGGVHGLPRNLNLTTLSVSGAADFSSTITQNTSCASGYQRSAPGVCDLSTNPASGTPAVPTSCTAIAAPAATATLEYFYILAINKSQNAVGNDAVFVGWYSDSGCTTKIRDHYRYIYEQVATAGAVQLQYTTDNAVRVPLPSAGATIYWKTILSTGSVSYGAISAYYEN